MVDSFDPYSEWLGRPGHRTPQDHYELLGLARFESDLDLIADTADALRAKIRKIRPGPHVAAWQRLLDHLEAAKICLSDPIAKAAYDESIDTTPHSIHVSSGPVVTQDASDPDPRRWGNRESLEAKGAVLPCPQPIEAPPVIGSNDADIPPGQQTGVARPQTQPSRPSPRWSRAVVGGLTAVMLLLLIGIGLVLVGQWQTTPGPVARTGQPSAENLPQGVADPGKTLRPVEPVVPPPDPVARAATVPPGVSPPPPSPGGAAANPQRTTPGESDAGPARSPAIPPPRAAPAVDPARQQAYLRAIGSARSALARRDLAAAANHLNDAVSLAQTDAEVAETDQVEALRAHLDAFWGSLQELVPKLESGSEIRVGSAMVVVVEAARQRVTLRVAGQNRPYSILGMPHPLAAAMAEQLFTKSFNANTLRAAFLIAEPEGDSQQARQLLEEASQGGAEVDELLAELNRRPPHGN